MGTKPEMGEAELRPMEPRVAEFFRAVCTELGLAERCPFKPCRRQRRCATPKVLCYQALRGPINALVQPALRARAEGAPLPEWSVMREAGKAMLDGRWPVPTAPDKVEPG
jgi:hypothetical protein